MQTSLPPVPTARPDYLTDICAGNADEARSLEGISVLVRGVLSKF